MKKQQAEAQETTEAVEAAKPDTTGLVPMHKDGVTTHVHPTCVESHVKAGWKPVN